MPAYISVSSGFLEPHDDARKSVLARHRLGLKRGPFGQAGQVQMQPTELMRRQATPLLFEVFAAVAP